MEYYKSLGYRPPELTAYAAKFAEYRMLSIMVAYTMALLFGNGMLILWGLLFFIIGFAAEKYPRAAMNSGMFLSGVIAITSFAGNGIEFYMSTMVFASIFSALSFGGFRKK